MIKSLSLVFLTFLIVSCSTSKEVEPLDEQLTLAEGNTSVLDDVDFGEVEDESAEFTIADLDEPDSSESGDLSFSGFEDTPVAKKPPVQIEDSFEDFNDVITVEDEPVEVPIADSEEVSFDSPLDFEEEDTTSFRQDEKQEPSFSSNSSSVEFNEGAIVTSIDYNAHHGGGSFMISTSVPADYSTEYIPETNQYVLKLKNTSIGRKLARPFLTKDFRQSFEAMNSYKGNDGGVRLVFQLKENSFPKVRLYEGKLIVEPGLVASSGRKNNDLTGGKGDDFTLTATSFEDFLLDKNTYSGKPVSIQVKDESVVSIIQFIAEEAGANVVLSAGVTGNISIKLKDVPWDQALVTIMKSKGLGYVRNGNILRVAPLEELKQESLAAAEVQKARRTLSPFHVKVFPLSYAAPEVIEAKVKPFLTVSAGGDATRAGQAISEVRSSSLIIRDTFEVIQNITALIKELDRPPLQVMISSKIVEASKEYSKIIQGLGVGANPGTEVNGGNFDINGGFNYATNSADPGSFLPSISIGGIDFLGTLTARLRLQEIDSKVKVLSSPSVMAINNEPAQVVQIDNVINLITTIEDNIRVTTPQFTPVELSLNVTPQVSADSNIIMSIEVKREVPNESPIGTSVGSRTAKTKVIVGNNKTAMIGGIYQVTESKNVTGAPVLRKLPLLGWLFKDDRRVKRDSELIIFVTPRVINRNSVGDNLADQKLSPGDGDSLSKY